MDKSIAPIPLHFIAHDLNRGLYKRNAKNRFNGFIKKSHYVSFIQYGYMPSFNQRRGKWINPLHLSRCIL